MEKMGEDFNKINKEVQPERDFNFEETQIPPKDNDFDSDEEIEIPSNEELEQLKETDMEEYLSWIDRISRQEEEKHNKEMEELERIHAIERKKELDELYTKDDDWWKN